ncbi:MAG TPA: hypothetical protein DCE42_18550 [Myxococcales bacterium]|nr:hypothetical protein [Myxococcales bacterium]
MSNGKVTSSFDAMFGGDSPQQPVTPKRESRSKLYDLRRPGGEQPAQEYTLIVVDPGGQEREFPVRGEIFIGNSPQNHVVIDDPSIAPNHMSIGTDGQTFWVQNTSDGGGISINGDYAHDGWLSGGEEIIIGQSVMYFVEPELDAPFGDFSDLDAKLQGAEGGIEGAGGAPIKQKKPSNTLWFLMVGTLYASCGGVLALGGILFFGQLAPFASITPNRHVHLKAALDQMLKGKQLIAQKEWQEANLVLKEAKQKVPKDGPFAKIFDGYIARVSKEVHSLGILSKAKTFFRTERAKQAYALLGKIPKDRTAYKPAIALRTRIFNSEVKPLIEETKRLLASTKLKEARNRLGRIFDYTADLPIALKLQEELETKEIQNAPPGSKIRERYLAKFKKGLDLFNGGQYDAAIKFFTELEAREKGLSKHKARKYKEQVTKFKEYLGTGIRLLRSSPSTAIKNLIKAEKIDKQLGGGNKAKYGRKLAIAYANKGKSASRSGNYGAAFRFFRKSNSLSANSKARSGLRRLMGRANRMYKQARVLKDLDKAATRKLVRKILKMVPASSSIHKRARRLLR